MSALLRIEGLSKRFGGLVAVNNVSFSVAQGEIVGLLGPNGSGKTTVINLVSGALPASAGSVKLQDRELTGLPAFRIARAGVARTFQLVRVLGSMNCVENVQAGLAFGTGQQPQRGSQAEARRLLERVGMGDFAFTAASELTYINQKRLELARTLALRPKLLLLDEWLSGLNPSELIEGIKLLRSLREDGITMVMVEHVMDAIRALCDRCVIMNAGTRIADAPPAAALADPEVVRAYLGDDDA
jgi:branched-chain amino acid transport system ATP-binding protein